MMKTAYQCVRVFHKEKEAKGNLAAIFFDNNKSELSKLTDASVKVGKQHNISTVCFIEHLVAEQYNVRCFNAENEIQCCGHGMIAAAKILFSDSNLLEIQINNNLIVSRENEKDETSNIELTLPRILSHTQDIPSWVNHSILYGDDNLSPSHSAISDKNDGYLLFEFEPLLALDVFSALKVNLKHVCDNTKRAIVLLQFEQDKQHLYMRYFAPQYGVAEDSATGSVMRFVTDYIEKKYKCRRFEVSQCSSQGGYMKIDCKEEKIIITANASIET